MEHSWRAYLTYACSTAISVLVIFWFWSFFDQPAPSSPISGEQKMESYEKLFQTLQWLESERTASLKETPEAFEARRKVWETHFAEAEELLKVLTRIQLDEILEGKFQPWDWEETLRFLMKTDSARTEALANSLPFWSALPETENQMWGISWMLDALSSQHCRIESEKILSLLHLLEGRQEREPQAEMKRRDVIGLCLHLLGQRWEEAWRSMLTKRAQDPIPQIACGAMKGLIELNGLMPCWKSAPLDFGSKIRPNGDTPLFSHQNAEKQMISWILLTHEMICGDGLLVFEHDSGEPQTPERYAEQLETVGLSEAASILRKFIPMLRQWNEFPDAPAMTDAQKAPFQQIDELNSAYFAATPDEKLSITLMRYVSAHPKEFSVENK